MEKGNPNVDLANQVLLFIIFFFFFFFFHFLDSFFLFSVSHFLFLNVKKGATPLSIAVEKGHEQIVGILLEKGNPNVDLANKVLLLIVFFFFFFLFLF